MTNLKIGDTVKINSYHHEWIVGEIGIISSIDKDSFPLHTVKLDGPESELFRYASSIHEWHLEKVDAPTKHIVFQDGKVVYRIGKPVTKKEVQIGMHLIDRESNVFEVTEEEETVRFHKDHIIKNVETGQEYVIFDYSKYRQYVK